MPRGTADEFLLARKFELYRPASDHGRERADILSDDFLFTAEATANAFAKDPYRALWQAKQVTEFPLCGKRRLRTGAHVETTVPHRAR